MNKKENQERYASREDMKAEALERMKLLQLHANAIREFRDEDKLNLSGVCGALYWLSDEQKKLVRDWEKKTGNLVYHVIHGYYDEDEMLNLLYISRDKSEWTRDRENIADEEILAYVVNLSYGYGSEYGYIGIRPVFGGVVRVW